MLLFDHNRVVELVFFPFFIEPLFLSFCAFLLLFFFLQRVITFAYLCFVIDTFSRSYWLGFHSRSRCRCTVCIVFFSIFLNDCECISCFSTTPFRLVSCFSRSHTKSCTTGCNKQLFIGKYFLLFCRFRGSILFTICLIRTTFSFLFLFFITKFG